MQLLSTLREAWYFYSRHLGSIVLLCLPLILTESVARLAITYFTGSQDDLQLQDLLVSLLFYPIYTAALILFLDARSRGLVPHNNELLRQALQRWLPLAILSGCSAMLIMLGSSLMVLPGLWVMVKVIFAEYLLVLRGLSPLAALKESFVATRGHFLQIFSVVLVVVLPLWAFDFWLGGTLQTTANPLLIVLSDGLSGLLQLFATVVFFRVYMLLVPPRP
ncbi:hypothetical protein [Azomonas macrocytogenes]|uniref:Transmembrane protein n=1 Tax=Azomonas macrocytogenes TaxID=69962 RepID=A0A839T2P3_AZOMA|nr:hypothetical protein [Azomonas macrocytogenes]MBB3102756.1 hypothetical protein [Azomonas macrocytogenes]